MASTTSSLRHEASSVASTDDVFSLGQQFSAMQGLGTASHVPMNATEHQALQDAQDAVNAGGASRNRLNSLYKTELCHSFEETGVCKYKDKCQFAHAQHELRQVSRHPKWKTQLCRTFHTVGTCPYGQRCHFVHTLEELRSNTESPVNPDGFGSASADGIQRSPPSLRSNRSAGGRGRHSVDIDAGLPKNGHSLVLPIARAQSMSQAPTSHHEVNGHGSVPINPLLLRSLQHQQLQQLQQQMNLHERLLQQQQLYLLEQLQQANASSNSGYHNSLPRAVSSQFHSTGTSWSTTAQLNASNISIKHPTLASDDSGHGHSLNLPQHQPHAPKLNVTSANHTTSNGSNGGGVNVPPSNTGMQGSNAKGNTMNTRRLNASDVVHGGLASRLNMRPGGSVQEDSHSEYLQVKTQQRAASQTAGLGQSVSSMDWASKYGISPPGPNGKHINSVRHSHSLIGQSQNPSLDHVNYFSTTEHEDSDVFSNWTTTSSGLETGDSSMSGRHDIAEKDVSNLLDSNDQEDALDEGYLSSRRLPVFNEFA